MNIIINKQNIIHNNNKNETKQRHALSEIMIESNKNNCHLNYDDDNNNNNNNNSNNIDCKKHQQNNNNNNINVSNNNNNNNI